MDTTEAILTDLARRVIRDEEFQRLMKSLIKEVALELAASMELAKEVGTARSILYALEGIGCSVSRNGDQMTMKKRPYPWLEELARNHRDMILRVLKEEEARGLTQAEELRKTALASYPNGAK